MNDEDEINIFLKAEINHLAALFYQMSGRVYIEDFDFSESSHPEEFGAWNQALTAYAVIQKDEWFLKFQVQHRIDL